jgi:chemotaxis protein MotB
MQKKVLVKTTSRGLVISLLTDHTSFESGSAVLQPAAGNLLTAIGPFLGRITNEIRVEGNTDNIPIATAEYPTNWELSTARAVVVTRFLAEQEHLNPGRLSAAGYGQFNPQTDNTSEAHRQLNRRVDIVILNTRPTNDADAEKSQQDDVGTVSGGN